MDLPVQFSLPENNRETTPLSGPGGHVVPFEDLLSIVLIFESAPCMVLKPALGLVNITAPALSS